VRTFLTRLEKKGVVRVEEGAEGKLYAPAISREACVGKESQSFLDRVFEGATASLLVHFAKSKPLSVGELAELEEILAKNKPGNS
jgi:predicted transcriptional regulator